MLTVSLGRAIENAKKMATIATRYAHHPLGWQLIQSPEKVTSQQSSPLYARLPPELREIIWFYALQQFEDWRYPYAVSNLWTRPERGARLRIAIELLLTCRLVYVETFLLPAACNTVHLFDGSARDCPPNTPLHARVYGPNNILRMKPWQFAAITSVDLTVQQAMLEGGT